jgi:RHS repeat-associated protein
MRSQPAMQILILVFATTVFTSNAFAAFGRTPGAFNVSSSGSAQYSIAIWVPPGVRGIQPNLSLIYDSRLGYGLMGPGWTLSGLSVIARCNLTYAQDGAPGAITLTAADGLCLDGNRLRTTGTSVYQTEIANFSQITASGTAGGGPSYFTVQGKDGLTYEYGNTTDSKILPSGNTTPYIWALDKVTDRAGNHMMFTYYQSGGAYVPLSIQYTAPSGSTTFPFQVNFGYTTKSASDTISKFIAGSQIQQTQQLSTITVTSSGTTVREYKLLYTTSSGTLRATLTSIQECGGNTGTDCLAATSVGYQSGLPGIANPTTGTGSGYNDGPVYSVDIDGDGRKDLVFGFFVRTSGLYHWYAQFATATGYGPVIDTGAITSTAYLLLDDFDATGGTQLLALKSTGVWYEYKWNGTAFASTATNAVQVIGAYYVSADIDGDGRPDLVTLTPAGANSTLSVYLNTSTSAGVSFQTTPGITQTLNLAGYTISNLYGDNKSPNSSVSHFDFNGDGRSDVILVASYPSFGWIAFELAYNGTSFVETGGASLGTGTTPNPFLALNFNDDACTDLMGTTELQISECNGNGFLDVYIPTGTAQLAVDWDGDGRTDVLANVNGVWELYRSEGNAFAPGVSTGISVGTGTWVVTDKDGDGLDDLIFRASATNTLSYGVHNDAGIRPDLATEWVDGYGVINSPVYSSISQNTALYTRGTSQVFPYQDYDGPLYVVNTTDTSDGTGLLYVTSYQYLGAVVNLQGRGFQGFGNITSTDARTGLSDKKGYETAFPYTGLLASDLIFNPTNSHSVQVIAQSPATLTLDGTAHNLRVFPYVSSSTLSAYEVGGSEDGVLISTAVTSFSTPDNYGNFSIIATTMTDNDSGSPYYNDQWTSTTTNTITPNVANWCLSLPTETTVVNSSTAPNGAAITRTILYNNPDYANCRETEKVIEPSSATYKVIEDYAYDTAFGNFGNLHSITVTGVGMSPRTTTILWTANGQYPQTITDPLSHSITLGFDPNTGMKTSQTDPNYTVSNPLSTTWTYDNFTRELSESRLDGTAITFGYNSCGATCVNANNKMTLTKTIVNVGGTTQSVQNTYLDWFDRPLVVSGLMLNGAYDRNEVQYDNLGRVHQQAAPCTFVSCTNYWITNYYDVLNRLTKSQRPISATNSTLQTTTLQYAGRTTVVTDPQGKNTTTINLVTGPLSRTQDNNGYYVNFGYDAFGSLLTVTDSLSNALNTMTYDYGVQAFQRTSMDADLGSRSYTYDALGEITAYSDAKGNPFSVTYDALSRPTIRTEPDLTTNWTWGNTAASFNIGQLQSVSAVSSMGAYSEAYGYDSKTRPSTEQITIPGDTAYTYTLTYNATTGLLDTLQYPLSTAGYQLKVQYAYQNGILQQVSDTATGTHYWTANAMNPRGQLTQETLGNGVVVNHALDAVTGWVSSIQAGVGGGAALQNNSYLFDEMGNLTQRQDGNLGLTENVYPDNLYRLDHTVGDSNTQMTYDGMGRILTFAAYGKPTVTNNFTTPQTGCTYYANSQLHAVRSSTPAGQLAESFCYDANGNLAAIKALGATLGSVSWTSFNQPSAIAAGTTSGQLFYNADHQRYEQAASYAGSPETTIYVGGLLEKVTNSSGIAYRHYIPAGNNRVVYTRWNTGSNPTYYITEDHQGSSGVITDQTGALVVKERFGAQGYNENTSTEQATIASISRHEYTGQEQIDNTGVLLTNMNGRIYSPVGSLFFSPDPYIPDPGNTQSFNRYSYVNNNPLTYTDPSGFDPEFAITVIGYLGGPENPWADVAGGLVEIADVFGLSGVFGGGGPMLTPNQQLAQAHGINLSSPLQGAPSLQSTNGTASSLGTEGLSPVVVTAHRLYDPEFLQGFSNAVIVNYYQMDPSRARISYYTTPSPNPDVELDTIHINGWLPSAARGFDPIGLAPGGAALECYVLKNCSLGDKFLAAAGMIPFGSVENGAARQLAPLARGGASLANIAVNDALRIQNAATRIGEQISLVGSRAAGTATAASDWDYVINGTSKALNSVSGSLPGAGNIGQGVLKNIDIFRGALNEALPSITFFPGGP